MDKNSKWDQEELEVPPTWTQNERDAHRKGMSIGAHMDPVKPTVDEMAAKLNAFHAENAAGADLQVNTFFQDTNLGPNTRAEKYD